MSLTEDRAPARSILTAESTRSAAIAEVGPGESPARDADRLKAARREALHASAFARLQARLETMPVIEQAKGILMAQQRCGPDEAFDLLRRASQSANVRVSVLAE